MAGITRIPHSRIEVGDVVQDGEFKLHKVVHVDYPNNEIETVMSEWINITSVWKVYKVAYEESLIKVRDESL